MLRTWDGVIILIKSQAQSAVPWHLSLIWATNPWLCQEVISLGARIKRESSHNAVLCLLTLPSSSVVPRREHDSLTINQKEYFSPKVEQKENGKTLPFLAKPVKVVVERTGPFYFLTLLLISQLSCWVSGLSTIMRGADPSSRCFE